MIVFLNIEEENITIYGEKGSHIIPFSKINQIYSIIGNKDILYITDVTETNAQDIVELVLNITGQEIGPPPSVIDNLNIKEISMVPDMGLQYIHSVNRGPFDIPDLNAPPEKYKSIIKFIDRYDIKLFDETFKEKMKKYPIINQCIKSGKLKIINENDKNELLKEKNENMKKKEKWISSEEQRRNNTSGKSAEEIANGMFKDQEVEELDFTNDLNFKTEIEQIKDKIGR